MYKKYADDSALPLPKYWPGDQVQDADEPEEIGIVEFARGGDGMVCVQWPSKRKEWVHESNLAWGPGFAPVRRR